MSVTAYRASRPHTKPFGGAAARPEQPLGRIDTKLGQAADNLSEWLAAIRNQISDAHDSEGATRAEADLALRAGLALRLAVRPHAAE